MAISPVVIDDFLAVLLLGNLAFLVLSGSARSLPRAGDRTGGFQMEGWTSARAASLRLPLLVPGQGRGRSGVCACMCACVFCVLSSEATYDLSLPPTPRHQEQYTVKFSLSLSHFVSRSPCPGAAVLVLGLAPWPSVFAAIRCLQ